MSREIDEKIVQMKFENGQFEKGVQTSIHSLEELKRGLDFKDASKGLENLDKSAKGLKFDSLSAGIEALNNRFTLLGITGLNVMNRIANAAIDTGKRMVESLSIDQITTGWSKYADKTSAVQTIMSATAKEFTDTGEQMEFVNSQLEKLNWFTDETSYNFLDMVSNIGKFTSNNIPLDQSVTSMQGIATWAAQSGANANEASRAMYNLSQAISSGSLRLQDWMSIENANMGTARFKETVIDTALELGTLKQVGDKVVTTTKGLEVSVTNFRNVLAEGWITGDVLVTTLEKYGAAANKLNEIVNQTGVTTSVLIEHIDDYTASYGNLSKVSKSLGKSQEETTAIFKKFSGTISNMAGISEKTGMSVRSLAEAVKEYNDGTIDLAGTASMLGMSAGELESTLTGLQAPIAEISNVVKGTGLSVEEFVNYISEYQSGSFDLAAVSQELGLSMEETQKIMEEFQTETMQFGLEAFKAAQEAKTFEEAITSVKDAVSSGWMKTFEYIFGDYEQAKELWTNLANILYGVFAESGNVRNEMMKQWADLGGRNYAIAAFYNTLNAVLKVILQIKKAWRSVFPAQTAESLLALTKRLADITHGMIASKEASFEMYKIFRSLFLLLDTGKFILSQAVKSGFSVLEKVLKELNIDISGFTKGLLAGSKSINDYVKKQTWLTDGVESFGDILVSAIRQVKAFLEAVQQFGPVKAVIDAFHATFTSDFNGISSIITFLGNTFSNFISLIANTPMPQSLSDIRDFFVKFGESVSEEFSNAGLDFSAFEKLITSGGIKILEGINLFVSGVDTAKRTAGSAVDYISSLVKEVDWSGVALLATGMAIVYLINKIAEAVVSVSNSLLAFTKIGKSIQGVLGGAKKVLESTAGIINAAKWAVYGAALIEASVAIGIFSASLVVLSKLPTQDLDHAAFIIGIVGVAITTFSAYLSKLPSVNKASGFLLSFAAAMAVFSYAMNSIDVTDSTAIFRKLETITIILLELVATCYLMSRVDKEIKIGVTSMLGIAASLWLILKVLDSISKYDQVDLFKALPMLVALSGIVIALSNFSGTTKILEKDQKAIKPTVFRNIAACVIGLYGIVHIIKILGNMDPEILVKGIMGLIPVMAAIMVLLRSSYGAGLYAEKAGMMILEISIALNLLVPAIKGIAAVPLGDIVKASAVIVALDNLAFKPLIKASKDAGPNAAKAGLMLLAMAGAMAILQLVVKTLGKLDLESLMKGVTAVSILVLSFAPLVEALGNSNEETIKALNRLIIIVTLMGTITFLLATFTDTTKALAAASSMAIMLAAIVVPLHFLDTIKEPNMKGLLALVGAIGLLGAITIALSAFTEDGPKAIMAATATGVMLLALAGALKIMDKIDMPSWDKGTSMIALVGIIGGIMIGLGAVSQAANPVAVLALTTGFSEILLSLAYSIKIMSQTKSKPSLANARAMSMFVAAIGGVMLALGIISQWADPVASLALATGMSEILVALGLSAKLLTKTKMPDMKQLLLLTAFAGGVGAVIAALSYVGDVAAMIPLATSITILLGAIAASIILLSVIPKAEVPIQAMGDMIVFSTLVGGLLALLSNVVNPDTVLPVAIGFSAIMLAMSAVTAILALIPAPNIANSINALSALTIFVGGMGLLLAAIGTLIGDADVAGVIASGGEVLKQIGIAIGGFVGGILGGFIGGTAEGIADSFPAICNSIKEGVGYLVEMMNSLENTPVNILDLIGTVSGFIAAITAAEFISGLEALPGLGALITEGKQHLKENFKFFGEAIMEFAKEVDGINSYSVKNAAEAVAALATATQAIPAEGGFFSMLFGTPNMDNFVENVPKLGEGLADFAKETEGITDDTIKGAINAASLLIELEKSLPAQDGALQTFLGTQDIGAFGERMREFGVGLLAFSNIVKFVDQDAVAGGQAAGQMLVDLENSLPREGGVLQTFLGKKDLGSFGDNLITFGGALADLSNKCKDIDLVGISRAVFAGANLAKLENSLTKESGGVLEFWFGGESNFKSFGDNLAWFGQGLASLSINASRVDFDVMSQVIEFIQTIGDAGNIGTSMKNLKDSVVGVCNEITTLLQNKNKELVNQGKQIGKNLIDGLIIGLTVNRERALDAITGFAAKLVERFEAKLDINSPSVVMAKEGEYIVKGVAEGIENDATAEEAAEKKAQNIIDAFQKIFDNADLKINLGNVQLEGWEAKEGRGAHWSAALDKQIETLQNELDATGEKVKASYAKWLALKQSGADEKTVQEAWVEYLETSNSWRSLRNEIIDAQIDSAESMIEEIDRLDEIRQAEYDRWLSSEEGKNASGAEKTAKEMELLMSQFTSLAKTTSVLRSKHKAIVDEFGEDSKEAQEAYRKVLESETKLNETRDDIIAKQTEGYDTIKEARDVTLREYSRLMDELAPKLLGMGFTEEQIKEEISKMSGFTKAWGNEISSGITMKQIDEVMASSYEMVDLVKEGIVEEIDDGTIEATTVKVVDSIPVAIKNVQPAVRTETRGVMNTIVDEIDAAKPTIAEHSANVFSGLLEGAKNSKAYKLTEDYVKNAENSLFETVDAVAEINSPSKRTMRTGASIMEGLAVGIRQNGNQPSEAAAETTENLMVGMSSLTSRLSTMISNDMDLTPTITPVLDMDNIINGSKKISGILNSRTGLSVSSIDIRTRNLNQALKSDGVVTGQSKESVVNNNFTQNNYSPKALSRYDIYRQTRNQISMLKGVAPK